MQIVKSVRSRSLYFPALAAVVLLVKLCASLRRALARMCGSRKYKDMPYAGWWYLISLVIDGKNANRKLYEAYKSYGIVRVKGITFSDEIVCFGLRDVEYCHKHEGQGPGGAGDILFSRQTNFYANEGSPEPNDNGLGPDSHGRRMFGRGAGHNSTRLLSFSTPMRSTPAVLKSAARCVDFITKYDHIMDWIQFHQIDMFFSVMIGLTPGLADPRTEHPLRSLPDDEEHAFVTGLLLSVLPWWLTISMERKFVKAMRNMTGLGVTQLREAFLSLPPESRPDSFMKSLLENGGSVQDAEEFISLFITAFQGNISLTLQNVIFHLANHPEAQERLHQECVAVHATGNHMKQPMPYLQAVLKESHRLTPITDFTQVRQYEHDLVLPSGWQLPAGSKQVSDEQWNGLTVVPAESLQRYCRVMMLNKCSCRDHDLIARVDEFLPERYLVPDVDENLNHFLQRSEFGSSSRSCLGRRTARVMLKSIIVELFRRYRLEASPARKSFQIDTMDPSFNRIKDFPKINLYPIL